MFGVGGGGKLGFDFFKFAVGFHNLRDVRPLALQQKENTGETIEQFAGENPFVALIGVQVFVQHQQVVAKIEEGFSRTLVGEGGPTNMENLGLGTRPNAVTHELKSPTQINFFHVCEEGQIQTSGAFPRFAFDEQRRTRSPENGQGLVILFVILFYVTKNSTSAERVTIFVDESAGCAGVFELVAFVIVDKVRLRRTQTRVFRNQF